jgi:uncharacterized protein YjbI with pentapeptide repeats
VFFPVVLTLVGGPFLIWRVITAHLAAIAARDQAEVGRESHYTTLFTKAVEQLGATREVTVQEKKFSAGNFVDETISRTEPNLEVRLGAIYALERIAAYSQRDHWPIMEVLSAYIRNSQNTGMANLAPSESKEYEQWYNDLYRSGPREDCQAALTVICRRAGQRIKQEQTKEEVIDFSGANLQRARTQRGNFSRANFRGAALDFAGFNRMDLEKAIFDECTMSGTHFSSSQLSRASFESCSLQRVTFLSCQIPGALFIEAKLKNVAFEASDLRSTSFDSAELSNVVFSWVNLTDVNFSRVQLSPPFLQATTRFRNVTFGAWSKSSSRFEGAELFHCDFSSCSDLISSDFEMALGDGSTKLPSQVERPSWWPENALTEPERLMWVHVQRQKMKDRAVRNNG